jgi:hypothetical protein
MRRKSNAAILEIGGFSKQPALADLQDLTLDPRDLQDLKACVVGDCDVKLSASMIERFRKEIDWAAPDYQLKATNLFKQMLLDYVRSPPGNALSQRLRVTSTTRSPFKSLICAWSKMRSSGPRSSLV